MNQPRFDAGRAGGKATDAGLETANTPSFWQASARAASAIVSSLVLVATSIALASPAHAGISAVATGQNSITVSGDVSPGKDIAWRINQGSTFTGKTVSSTSNRDTKGVTGLTAGTTYTVLQYQCTDGSGYKISWGSYTSYCAFHSQTTVTTQSPPAAVPGTISDLAGTAADGQVALTWSAPSSTGSSISSYTITTTDTSTSTSSTTTSATNSATITGLTNGTAYSFTVFATNSTGNGSASNTVTKTPAGVPTAPQNVTVTMADDSTAVVSWSAPASDGGSAITAYAVSVSGGSGSETCTLANPTDLQCTASGLTPGTTYTFDVTATNAEGTGPAGSSTGGSAEAAVAVTIQYSTLGMIAIDGLCPDGWEGPAWTSWSAPNLACAKTIITYGDRPVSHHLYDATISLAEKINEAPEDGSDPAPGDEISIPVLSEDGQSVQMLTVNQDSTGTISGGTDLTVSVTLKTNEFVQDRSKLAVAMAHRMNYSKASGARVPPAVRRAQAVVTLEDAPTDDASNDDDTSSGGDASNGGAAPSTDPKAVPPKAPVVQEPDQDSKTETDTTRPQRQLPPICNRPWAQRWAICRDR